MGTEGSHRLGAGAVTLIYAGFAAAWIVASGSLLVIASSDLVTQGRIEVGKGLAFVLVTSGLLFYLLKAAPARVDSTQATDVDSYRAEVRRLLLVLGILLLTVPLIGFSVFVLNARQVEQDVLAELQVVAQSKVRQLEGWLGERRAEVALLGVGLAPALQSSMTLEDRGAATVEALRAGLDPARSGFAFDAITLFDAQGGVVASEGDSRVPIDRLDALVAATRAGGVRVAEVQDAQGHPAALAFATPLGVDGNGAAQAIVVVQANAQDFLLPQLRSWPVAGKTGHIVMLRRDQSWLTVIGDHPRTANDPLQVRRPLPGSGLPQDLESALLADGGQAGPGASPAVDERGVEVLTAWHPVGGTRWHLLARQDRAEALRPAWTLAFWTAAIAMLGGALVGGAVLLLFRQQRRARQLALQTQADSLLQKFFDLPFIGMAATSHESKRWLRFNDQMCTILGYSREELQGKDWLQVTHPDDRESDLALFAELVAGRSEGYCLDKRFVRKDGEVRLCRLDVKGVRNASGGLEYMLATVDDVSGRRHAEQALVASEERFRSLLQNVPTVAVQGYAMDGTTRYWNHASEKLYGYTAEEALGRNLMDLIIPPPMRAHVQAAMLDMAATGEPIPSSELTLVRKDGELVTVYSSHAAVDVPGRESEMFCIDVDLTERKRIEQALQSSEAEFRTLVESIPQIVWAAKPDGDHVLFNQHWMDYTGLSLEQSLGEGWIPPFHPEDRQRAAQRWQASLTSGELYEIEYRLRRADGVYHWMLGRALPMRDAAGNIAKWLGTCTDIDELKRAEQALQARARQQSLVASLGRIALAETDIDQVFSQAAVAVAEGMGVEFSRLMLLGGEDRACLVKAGVGWDAGVVGQRLGVAGEHSHLEYVANAGAPVIFDDLRSEHRFEPSAMLPAHGVVSGIDVLIGGRDAPIGVLGAYARETRRFSSEDVGFLESVVHTLYSAIERTRTDERLAYMAQHDALTDLPNRLLLTDRLQVAVAHGERAGTRLAVLFMDLDRFKNVNDVFGHDVGDQVLREVAIRLKSCVRAEDTVSRQGGDEFLVVLPEIEAEQDAARVAEKLINALAHPFTLDGSEVVISGSIGIACYPENGSGPEALLRNADSAMYAAKDRGRNRYQFYSAEMNARAAERLLLEVDLRRAMELDQLYLVYQPQLDLGCMHVVGVEALIRWAHPHRGIIAPTQFIPIAEESGLIVAIGSWVLETACTQHARWVRDGLVDGTVAVNVSAQQFSQPDFVDVVAAALARSGLAPGRLELEVTESAVMRDLEEVLRKLQALCALGVKLAIDDFGTGYSSLSYLKKLPLHRLKIDQSFTQGLPDDRESGAIAQAIISMGHSLRFDVLAEGIETQAQQDFLKALGCNAGQGYLYARPLDGQACGQYLQARLASSGGAAREGNREPT